MKRNFSSVCFMIILAIFSFGLFAQNNIQENADGSVTINNVDFEEKAVSYKQKADGFQNVTVIAGKNVKKIFPVSVSLKDYSNKMISVKFSCDIKVHDTKKGENEITWMINDIKANMPVVSRKKIKSDEWTKMEGEITLQLGENKSFYITSFGLDVKELTFYIKNFKLNIIGDGIGKMATKSENWLEVKSLKEAYKPYFDYFGLAVEYDNEFSKSEVQKGVKYHADYITMGNDFKPDFIFNWQKPSTMKDFVAENGKKYKVPDNMPNYRKMPEILEAAKKNGLKLRGHVLVWHSQTPEWFFKKNYNEKADFVSSDEMNARMEWYIKTVLQYVNDWEKNNNNNERIVKVWDVVNEACSDNATETKWLREDSNWYRIYQSDEFIVNAFRYANKYAPKEVELVYNDYNSYIGSSSTTTGKNSAIIKVIDAIQKAPNARIDAVGMQTHVKIDFPSVTGADSFETAVKRFVDKGLNVQITEMDVANGENAYSPIMLRQKYNEYFKMFIKNRKTSSKKGIEGITFWGLLDEKTWLNYLQQYKGKTQYPLLFNGNYICKPAFYGVLEAAENK